MKFPAWPTWNYQFPTHDVRWINAIHYTGADGERRELPREFYRLAVSRHGVSALVFLKKNQLPELLGEAADAVEMDYTP